MRRLFHPFALVFAAALLGALVAAGSAAAQVGTLEGEGFQQFGTFANPQLFQVSGTCNPTATSTFSFTVSNGVAVGPYPGVVNASGFGSFGAQVLPPEVQSGFPFTTVGQITDFHEYFDVTSAEGTVSGTKDLTEIADQPFNEGAWATAPDGTTSWYFFANTTYDAVITTPTGQFSDSGLSFAEMQPIFDQQTGAILAAGFSEYFLASNGLVPFTTTGQATGGGQIGHVDGSPGAVFGFTVYSRDDGTILGQCNLVDGSVQIRCVDVTQYSQFGNQATFSGTGTQNGAPITFRISVTDNGDSGIGKDTFSITTSSGYSAAGTLTQGDIQVH